jgi:hypothetical protein
MEFLRPALIWMWNDFMRARQSCESSNSQPHQAELTASYQTLADNLS